MAGINWLISIFVRKMDNGIGLVANANINLKAAKFAVASVSIAAMMTLNSVLFLNAITYFRSNSQAQYEMVKNYQYVARDLSQWEINTNNYLGMKNIRMIIRNADHLDGIYGVAVNNDTINIRVLSGKKSVKPGQIMLSQNVHGFSAGEKTEVWFPNGEKAVLVVSGIFESDSDSTGETVDCIVHDDLALKNTYSNEYDFLYFNEQVNGSIENKFSYYTSNPDFGVQKGASLLLVGIAALLSAIVLFNTYAVMMHIRRKEFISLKIIGASKAQVLRMTLIETAIVLSAGIVVCFFIIVPVIGKYSVENLGVFDFVVAPRIFGGICLGSAVLGMIAGMVPSFLTIFRLKERFRNE